MRKIWFGVMVAAMLVAAGFAIAGKPDAESSDKGHIWDVIQAQGLSGDHYTLNIHGKKTDFNKEDCTAQPDPLTGEYGNSIFVPSNSELTDVVNQIEMLSGRSGGKKDLSGDLSTYGVRDSCTGTFDGDAAQLVLPPNEKGYVVVARVLGKPTNNPQLTLEGELMFVEDESSNDLMVLGLVTDGGFETPSASLTRAKGNVRAVDITGLFNWNGEVCYLDATDYCADGTCTTQQMCCTDSDEDGLFDECVDQTEFDVDGNPVCTAEGAVLQSVGCRTYEDEWVFNIGDFVGYMWNVDAEGDFKLANIRFYPVQ